MPRRVKVFNFDGFRGCVQRRKSRQTGKLVGIYHNEQAGMDSVDGEYPWSTVCEEHGQIIAHQTIELAKAHAATPLDWCEVCNGNIKEEEA